MRKLYSFAVLLAMLLVGTNTMKAQDFDFTGEVTAGYYESDNWAWKPITFKLSEVAAKLGTDAATLASELTASYPDDPDGYVASSVTVKIIAVQNDGMPYDGTASGFTTSELGGYYMTIDGDPKPYSEAAWYTILRWDLKADQLIFRCGRHLTAMGEEGKTAHSFQILEYNGVQVKFGLTYILEPKPEAAEVEKQFSKLNILEDKAITINVSQKPRSNYDSDAVSVEVPTLLADLGFASPSDLVMQNVLYTRMYKYDALSMEYTWEDSISNSYTATAPGFWFAPTYVDEGGDEPQEDKSNLAAVLISKQWSTGLFYAEAFAFNRTEGVSTLSFNIGQMPNIAGGDEEYHTTLYLVNGNKAVPVYINLSIERVERKDFADMEQAGENIIEVKLLGDLGTQSTTFTFDNMEEILAALDLTLSDVTYYGLDSEGVLSTRQTANGGGSWFNTSGYVSTWGESATRGVYIEYDSATKSTFTIGTDGVCHFTAGQDLHIDYYLIGLSKYWHFDITIHFVSDDNDYSTWTKKGTLPMTITCVAPNSEYEFPEVDGNVVDMAKVQELLGTSNVAIYCQKLIPAAEEGGEGTVTWSNSYNCDPKPGFWMDSTGKYIGAWGDGAAYAFSIAYSTGVITMFNMPGSRQPGDSYRAMFYMANEAAETYVELPITFNFAESLSPVETVGEQTIFLKWTSLNQDSGMNYNYVDMEDIVNKVFDGDETMMESAEWLVYSDGAYQRVPAFETEYNYWDIDGNYLGSQESEAAAELYFNAIFSVGFDTYEQAFTVSTVSNLEWKGDAKNIDVAVEYDYKRYYLHIYVGNSAQYDELITGLNNLTTAPNKLTGAAYDLTGRRVETPAKGLYIIGGKKVLVK